MTAVNAIGQSIKDTGSTFYEALTSCGYHPQRKELTCPIEIRQPFGFAGGPALQPAGSYEYVLFCVNAGAGMVPVNVNGVHVHDEVHGANPNWYLSAVVPADGDLFGVPLRGQTLVQRHPRVGQPGRLPDSPRSMTAAWRPPTPRAWGVPPTRVRLHVARDPVWRHATGVACGPARRAGGGSELAGEPGVHRGDRGAACAAAP